MRFFLSIFNKIKSEKTAQSASELAIFGAILIFVIGLIVRSGLNSSHIQNAQLRAARMALNESRKSGVGTYSGGNSSAARNMASIMLVEDRLSVESSAKVGTRDRVPYMTQGVGMAGPNLFMPIHFNENYSLPVFDAIINGQRFPFTTAGFRSLRIANADGTKANWIPDCPNTADFRSGDPPPYGICWINNCFSAKMIDPSGDGYTYITIVRGCAIMYKVVVSHKASKEWCPDSCNGTSVSERFDLNFNGVVDADEPSAQIDRDEFSWQWKKVGGFQHGGNIYTGAASSLLPGVKGIWTDFEDGKLLNTLLDVDGDLHEEQVLTMTVGGGIDNSGQIEVLHYMDYQSGDLNPTIGDRDDLIDELSGAGARRRGMANDLVMFSFTRDPGGGGSGQGTVLRNEEGRLYNPVTNQFIRNTTWQDHIDIIQRIFYLERDTDRFCDGSGNRRDWTTDTAWARANGVDGLVNPVEVCSNNCFSQANITQTCMDESHLIIFVRSRIEDLRGRRWITPTR